MTGRILIAILAIAIGFSTADATTIFGAGGIGYTPHYTTVRSTALGGAGLALADSLYIPMENPGGWYSNGMARYSVGAVFRRATASDDNTSDTMDDFVIPTVYLVVPFYRTFSVGLSYCALFDHEYLFFQDGTWTPETPLDTTESYDYSERFQGKGGLSRASLTVSTRLWNIGIGLSGDMMFGTVEDLWKLQFESSNFEESGRFSRYEMFGVSARLGLLADLSPQTSVGVTVQLPTQLEATNIIKIEGGDSLGARNLRYDLPLSIQVGAAHSIHRIRGVMDVGMEFWEEGTRDFYAYEQYNNTLNAAFGVERLPLRSALDPWYEKWIFRAGFHYYQNYRDISGEPMSTMGFAAGAGIPLRTGAGILDFAFFVDLRGSESANGATETVFGMQLGWGSAQRWFYRRPR